MKFSTKMRLLAIAWSMACFLMLGCQKVDATTAFSEDDTICAYVIESSKAGCIQNLACSRVSNTLTAWEDCTTGVLFEVSDASVLKDPTSSDCNGFLTLSDDRLKVILSKELDAEKTTTMSCDISNIDQYKPTNIEPLDVNEEPPQPLDGSLVTEVDFAENQKDTVITSFTYFDSDEGETDTLNYAWVTDEFSNTFSVAVDKGTFTLSTKEALDYEKRSVYRLQLDIISIDGRGKTLKTTHTVLLFVTDVGDTAPYWLETAPSVSLDEGVAGRWIYRVEAEDRDFNIGNKVEYSIIGDDSDLFAVDRFTGDVTLANAVDHEAGQTSFIITIVAQEYIGEDPDIFADEPSSANTTTNLRIVDINDEWPTFSSHAYEVEMDEVVDHEVPINVDISVSDKDATFQYNHYTLSFNYEDCLKVSPTEGNGDISFKLTALNKPDGVFDFETADGPIEIALKAVETDNSAHFDEATLLVTLKDKNDHSPKFSVADYSSDIHESQGMGTSVVTVVATDGDRSDEYGTKSIRYSIAQTCIETLAVDTVTGDVTLAQDGALNYEDKQEVVCEIYADDNLGGVESNRDKATITIRVIDVNDSPPSISVSNGEIEENSKEGTVVPVSISATDQDTTSSLTFSINWDSSSALKDEVDIDDISKVIDWFIIENQVPEDGTFKASLKIGAQVPDREVADTVKLSILVTDEATDINRATDSGIIEIKIIDENDTPPSFVEDYDDLRVKENSPANYVFAVIEVTDADENDQVSFSVNDNTYVDLVQENPSDFKANFVVSGIAEIDREVKGTIVVVVDVIDANNNVQSKELTIIVMDDNDNAPYFEESIIFGSFTESDSIGKRLVTFQAKDLDLNETLNYQLERDFLWPDGGPTPPPDAPFRVQKDENEIAELFLNFDPVGVNDGYCNFTITCLDNHNTHSTTILGKVYAITSHYQVSVEYQNPVATVQSKSLSISRAFTEAFGYRCIIDSIVGNEDSSSTASESTTVKMHFINEDLNEPVKADSIIESSNDASVSQMLLRSSKEAGLDLVSIGDIPQDDGGSINELLLLQILLGVVSLVLGSLLLLLLITYFMRTRSLERRLKVASATTFGSVSSNLNRMDIGGGVPGSNKFAGEGTNPVYQMDDANLRNDDSSSIDSGDSVLVGVEDNPEFKRFPGTDDESFEGHSNPAFSRSIDEVAAPSPLSGGTRSNPLLNEDFGGDVDLADALQNFEMFIRRGSVESGVSTVDSYEVAQNSNFSFGNKL